MSRLTKKFVGRIIMILLLCLIVFNFGNGQNKEVIPVVGEKVEETQELIPQTTNLDILLVDRINDSQIRLTNCVLVLAGELRICEDSFTYNNTFTSGELYKITVLVELKNKK